MKYQMRCTECKAEIIVEHPMQDPHPATHEGCGGKLVRVFVDVGVVYKGDGFYSTDRLWKAKGDSFE